MILYNLTIKIDTVIENQWLDWMQTEFIPHILNSQRFSDHKLCRLLGLEEADGITFALQLFCKNIQDLESFKKEEESNIQVELLRKFPNQLVFFPTAMEIL